MIKRMAVCCVVTALTLSACTKPAPSVAPAADPTVKAPAPAKAGGGAESTEWKIETGKADAKVEIYCFFPMNTDHQWVKDLNKKIGVKWPEQVHVIHVDWWSDEGKDLHKQKLGEPCSAYLVNGKVICKKSQALGGWTEEKLMAAIGEAVDEAYGGGTSSAKPAKEAQEEKK